MAVKAYLGNKLFLIGLSLALLGCGPLLAIILLSGIGLWPDPNPNPIGPGILFFLTCWPAAIFLLAGVFSVRRRKFREQLEQGRVRQTVNVDATFRPELTSEQAAYVAGSSNGAGFGLIYYAYMGVPGQFFRHLPMNFIWPWTLRHARRHVWEGRSWPSFEQYKARNESIDKAATGTMYVLVPLLLLFLS